MLATMAGNLSAQDEVDFQLWMNYALTVPVTPNLSYGGDVGLRGLISNYDWNQYLIRPTITYRWNQNIAVAGAVAWFHTLNRDTANIREFRIHQDISPSWPDLGVVSFFYRLRIEQRWFFYETLPDEFNLRIRYLFGLETQDFRLGEGRRPFYFQFIWEGFKTAGDDNASEVFINQSRTHAAFGHRLSPAWRYELHFIGQRSRLYSEDGLNISQRIFRIRLFHRLAGPN